MSEKRIIKTKLLDDLDFSAESIDKAMSEFKTKKKGDGKRGPFYNVAVDDPWVFDIDNKKLFQNAVWQGYLDASRTFSGIKEGKTKENPLAFHHLAGSIQRYFKKDKIEFIHTVWCIDFMDAVREINHYSMRYGQAQKVVNMAFKYLYCCDGANEYMEKFDRCHMPLDQYTLGWLFLHTGTLYQEWSWFDEKTYNEVAGTIKDILGSNILGKELVIWQRFSDKNNPVLINLKQKKRGILTYEHIKSD